MGDDLAAIAARLGRAQRAVILSLSEQWGPASSHKTARRMFWGIRGGHYLVNHKHQTDNCWSLTPLGIALKAHLEQSHG